MDYDEVCLYFTTSQIGGERRGYINIDNDKNIQINLIRQTGRLSKIRTTHPIEFIGKMSIQIKNENLNQM